MITQQLFILHKNKTNDTITKKRVDALRDLKYIDMATGIFFYPPKSLKSILSFRPISYTKQNVFSLINIR